MKKKKIVTISIIAILIVAVMLASYVLIIMPKMDEGITTEEIAKVEEEEKFSTGAVSTSDWNSDRVNIVYDTANVPVPVPKGYVASGVDGEHTVNTGFVIYEGEKDVVDEVTDSNTQDSKEDAQKTRNQWVWVPVENPSDIYGTDSEGKKHGKLYQYVKDNDGSIRREALNWSENGGVMSITDSRDYREPDILIGYDYDSYMPNYLTEETRNNINDELKENFEMTIESIKKYGGFYIGRYETGGLSGEAKVVRKNEDISRQTWYTMYEKSKELRGNNSNVRTSMIWGCQWDATLEWLVKSRSKTYNEVASDSTSWGNYRNITVDGHWAKSPTGDREEWKANNIYDMAGNVWEWTLEAYGTPYRVYRGGFYNDGGNGSPANRRSYGNPYTRAISMGTRATLYVAL